MTKTPRVILGDSTPKPCKYHLSFEGGVFCCTFAPRHKGEAPQALASWNRKGGGSYTLRPYGVSITQTAPGAVLDWEKVPGVSLWLTEATPKIGGACKTGFPQKRKGETSEE